MPEKEKCKESEQKKRDCGCGCLGTVGNGVKKAKTAAEKK